MELSTRYNPRDTEERWYQYWMDHEYFKSVPDEREPYTIVIPPPNVTGVLHMGHMLNNTIQDILIRKARLEGKNACWVPGTDHASIATEAKVVKMLREQGITKSSIGREAFLKHAFEWKETYGGIILDQLKRLGASCDWSRTRFTMEESLSKAVIRAFVDLHQKGKIYRGLRMTNWDPAAKTVLSNEEVIHTEEQSLFFYLRYPVVGEPDTYLTIATQRPETIMADVAVAVHPDDPRFQHLIGKNVRIPLVDREVPIIADTYVDREFGTGALKITPAHDQNDYEVGQRHNLEVIDILTEDGHLNEHAVILVGEERFVARKKIHRMLEEAGYLEKVEPYKTKIGRSERTNSVVEPRLSLQWFMDMKSAAKTALDAVENNEVRFFPDHFRNMYHSWLQEDNVRDWCISRQLWWGQRIPAWYYEKQVFVAETAEEALEQARKATGNTKLNLSDLQQEEDVVDTWFSSWLWPISVFDGFESQEELAYYYPTNVLVTGWDIMFFWVARMIMAGYEWAPELLGAQHVKERGARPFHDVYFTGMVRDVKRKKMSKQFGNSPDALALIDEYGADGVRFGLLSSGSAGNDIIFDAPIDEKTKAVLNQSKLCEQGRNFSNKMWNALRLIQGWEAEIRDPGAMDSLAAAWLENRIKQTATLVLQDIEQYRLSDALMKLYSLIWDDFCSWYLEMLKPTAGNGVSASALEQTRVFMEQMMTLLHPFMPFVTEEIWHHLRERKSGDDCIVSSYPKAAEFDSELIAVIDKAKALVAHVRDTRNTNGLKQREPLPLKAEQTPAMKALAQVPGWKELVCKMAYLSELELVPNFGEESGVSFLASTEQYFIPMEIQVDVEAEQERIKEEIKYYQGFIRSVQAKLSNERFVSGAPDAVVTRERQKLADGEEKLKVLEDQLKRL